MLIEEAQRQRTTYETALKTAVQAGLEERRAGMDNVAKAPKVLQSVRRHFDKVNELNTETAGMIGQYETIKTLVIARRNLRALLRELSSLEEIPNKVAAINTQLESEDPPLLQIHESVWQLEKARVAVLHNVRDNPEQLRLLKALFSEVDALSQKLAAQLWKGLASTLELARRNPAKLVSILRVIERQTKLDESEGEAAAQAPEGGPPAPTPKDWFLQAQYQLNKAIHARFQEAFSDRVDSVSLTLQAANEVVDDLADVLDLVVPCFPPRYKIFDIFVDRYQQELYAIMASIADKGTNDVSHAEILDLISWTVSYFDRMHHLGVSADKLEPDVYDALNPLVLSYLSTSQNLMAGWLTNIIITDSKSPPIEADEGLFVTPAPTDVFKIVQEQLGLTEATGCARFQAAALERTAVVLTTFQGALSGELTDPDKVSQLPLEYICAQVNNNTRCAEEAGRLRQAAAAGLKSSNANAKEAAESAVATLKKVEAGFHDVAKTATGVLVDIMARDLEPLWGGMFEKEWYEGDPLVDVFASLLQYWNELEGRILPNFHRKMTARTLEGAIAGYMEALCTKKHSFDDRIGQRMIVDEQTMKDMFAQFPKASRTLSPWVMIMKHLRDILTTEYDTVQGQFESIRAIAPDFSAVIVERLLGMRKEVSGSISVMVNECRELEPDQAERLPDGPGGLPGVFGRIKDQVSRNLLTILKS